MHLINKKILVSDAKYFSNKLAINALMSDNELIDTQRATKEHKTLVKTCQKVGIEVIQVPSPSTSQDGIYVANWGIVFDNNVLLSKLPNTRKSEQNYAQSIFTKLGLKVYHLPEEVKLFSGQGDCLMIDGYVFAQSPYRTDYIAHKYIAKLTQNKVYSLQTKPLRWFKIGPKKKNKVTGLLDSPSYDLDLALAILRPKTKHDLPLIAYCPSLFIRKSKRILKGLKNFEKIEVSKKEALSNYALNLVSTGDTVIMNQGTKIFKNELLKRNLKVVELDLQEIKKGGGSVRCCSLTLQ